MFDENLGMAPGHVGVFQSYVRTTSDEQPGLAAQAVGRIVLQQGNYVSGNLEFIKLSHGIAFFSVAWVEAA
jgi:hypothetical protein